MIKKKSILSMFTLFAISIIMISAYATDAATNPLTANSSAQENEDVSVSYNQGYGNECAHSAWLNNKLNTSNVQVRIRGNVDGGIGNDYNHIRLEFNKNNEWQTWNHTEYISKLNDSRGYNTLGILTGPKPLNSNKVNITGILDRIGQEEAQFDDVQHVTLYGIDDATVIEYYGYGDCWADSCWLYNKLTAAGIPVRIMGYVDGGIGDGWRHTWIEINIGNGWQNWDYKKYNSKHAGDNGYGTPFVLIEPGNAPADVMRTGY